MPTARPRPPLPPRGAALVVVLALLATAAAGCARKGAGPASGPAQAAQAPALSSAKPAAAPSAAPSGVRATAGSAAPAAVTAAPASPAPAAAAPEPPATPELTLEQMQRRSPSAALVETFDAACAEPARAAVRRAARRLEFTPVAAGAPPRDGSGAAAAPPGGGEAWRGPEEVGGAVLVWDDAASTCELRAEGVNLLLVEAAFSRLSQALEEGGSSVVRLAPPATPAGGVRTRQMLLVQPAGPFGRPERARVLRLGHRVGAPGGGAAGTDGGDTVTLSARAVSAPR